MPLLRKPTTQELEDHFFGSGAFSFGWFSNERISNDQEYGKFPVRVVEWNEDQAFVQSKTIDEQIFIEGIKQYAEYLDDRTFDDLIEDMDSVDVDNVLQFIMFGGIKYS